MTAPRAGDRRSRRTRTVLKAALLDLVAERNLVQISVSDVAKRADVNRSTFYEHYTDVHDLAAAACTELFDELIAATPTFPPDPTPERQRAGQEALTGVFSQIAERAGLYRAVLGPDGSARVIDHLHRRLTIAVHVDFTRPAAGTHAQDPAEIPHDPAASFIAGAILGAAGDWLRRGCPETPDRLSAEIWPLLAATPVPGPAS